MREDEENRGGEVEEAVSRDGKIRPGKYNNRDISPTNIGRSEVKRKTSVFSYCVGKIPVLPYYGFPSWVSPSSS